jgi:DNA-binding IclR family transcriptional regulator
LLVQATKPNSAGKNPQVLERNMTTRNSAPKHAASQINQAGEQVFTVLGTFVGRKTAAGVSEVSTALGITKNKAFRALNTLVDRGYLVRDGSGTLYDIGWNAVALQPHTNEVFDIRALCRPFMERLHMLTKETIYLSVIAGRNQLVVDGVEAHGVHVGYTPRNLLVPLHAGPASRALLAFLTDDEVAAYLRAASPLKRFTVTTITGPENLWQEVRRVREQGYARGYGDHYTGATYVAFPILDSTGRPHASVSIAAPADRLPEARLQSLLPDILAIVEENNVLSRLYPVTTTIEFGMD